MPSSVTTIKNLTMRNLFNKADENAAARAAATAAAINAEEEGEVPQLLARCAAFFQTRLASAETDCLRAPKPFVCVPSWSQRRNEFGLPPGVLRQQEKGWRATGGRANDGGGATGN